MIILFIALFSLCIGSFLNLLIYRLPLMLEEQQRKACESFNNLPQSKAPPLNLFLPRSFCPQCKSQLEAWHNIPLVSFFLLSGRCKTCHHPISWRYPLVEGLSLLFALVIYYFYGLSLHALFAASFIFFTLPLFFIDLKTQLLPDSLTLSLLWVGLIANLFHLYTPLEEAVIAAVVAYLFLWVFIHLYYLITGKIGMGYGDFKLFAALGAWFGVSTLPYILIFSAIFGVIVGGLYLKITHKTKDYPIPFGPFLCIAGVIVLFIKPIVSL